MHYPFFVASPGLYDLTPHLKTPVLCPYFAARNRMIVQLTRLKFNFPPNDSLCSPHTHPKYTFFVSLARSLLPPPPLSPSYSSFSGPSENAITAIILTFETVRSRRPCLSAHYHLSSSLWIPTDHRMRSRPHTSASQSKIPTTQVPMSKMPKDHLNLLPTDWK